MKRTRHLFWIYGDPATGKTSLASDIYGGAGKGIIYEYTIHDYAENTDRHKELLSALYSKPVIFQHIVVISHNPPSDEIIKIAKDNGYLISTFYAERIDHDNIS